MMSMVACFVENEAKHDMHVLLFCFNEKYQSPPKGITAAQRKKMASKSVEFAQVVPAPANYIM